MECLAHLNDYADMYLDKIEVRAAQAPPRKSNSYRPGILGKYLALSLHPNNRSKKIKSPAATNHLHASLPSDVAHTFQQNLQRYAEVIDQLNDKSLRGSRVPFSLTPLVRFHLGDILTCMVWHNARHIDQAREAISDS